MDKFELIAPCHFGLEAVMKREILDLGYEIIKVEDGKVTFSGDAEAIVRANKSFSCTGNPKFCSMSSGTSFRNMDMNRFKGLILT